MAFPPVIPPNTRTNDTDMVNAHASDHNAISNALTELVAIANRSNWGVLPGAYRQAKVASPGATAAGTEAIIPELSGLTITAINGRRYRIMAWAAVKHTVANAPTGLNLKDGTAILNRGLCYNPNAGFTTDCFVMWEGVLVPGAHTINLYLLNAHGSGSAGMDNVDWSSIRVEDAGPSA